METMIMSSSTLNARNTNLDYLFNEENIEPFNLYIQRKQISIKNKILKQFQRRKQFEHNIV